MPARLLFACAIACSLLIGVERTDPAMAATFTVNSTGDGPDILLADGVCATTGGACTLRAAIEQANFSLGADTITFAIGSGAQTIAPASTLPSVVGPVAIDATTQPGFAGAPLITLSGASAGADVDGLAIVGGSTTVRGLVINGFDGNGVAISGAGGNTIAGNYIGTDAAGGSAVANTGSGIYIDGSASNTVGGTASGDRNVISGNGTGVTLINGASGNSVVGNYVGLDATGASGVPNANTGVEINEAPSNTIGGLTAAERNIISGNAGLTVGVSLIGPATSGNQVIGNYIGTDVSGLLDVGNSAGVHLGLTGGNVVGGLAAGARNIISGNSTGVRLIGQVGNGDLLQGNYIGTDPSGTIAVPNGRGIAGTINPGGTQIFDNVISGNTTAGILAVSGNQVIRGNLIGTQADGTSPLPNGGHGVDVTDESVVGGIAPGEANTIAFNTGKGVRVGAAPSTVAVRGNSIHSNGLLGIDLSNTGVIANDTGDADTGPNNLQNYPVITSVSEGAGTTQIIATLNSTPNTTLEVDFYANTACDLSGYGEGETYIGSVSVTTDANGDVDIDETYTFTLDGRGVTATATDPDGATSEFSLCFGPVDTDGDGCSNAEESGPDPNLGGDRDPASPWDFYDVPTPAFTASSPNGMRNKAVSLTDVGAVLFYVGTTDGGGTNPNGVDYDTDHNANTVDDGREYDRTPSTVMGEPWHSGPPDGAVSLSDVGAALSQVGDNCVAPP